jgi:hypothetical protein
MARAKNYTLGRGKLFVDLFDADGNTTGEFYIGNTTSLTISGDEEVLPHYDSDEGIREQDDEAPLSSDVAISFTTDDIQPENLALFIKGEIVDLTTAAAADQTETLTVRRGRHYQLGTSATNPSGLRALDNIVLSVSGGADITAEGNYTVDEALGRVYILEDAVDIEDGDEVDADYDVTASTRSVIISRGEKAEGALRYVSANPKGPQRDHYFPKVTLAPDGDYELKGDEWQAMSFTGSALKKPGLEKHYIDGRAVTA